MRRNNTKEGEVIENRERHKQQENTERQRKERPR
jgi:hypothetical protein